MNRQRPNDDEVVHQYIGISAVDRALRILELMVGSTGGLSVSELSDALQVNKSIISRILTSLETTGYVRQDPSSRRYGLTFKLIGLAYRHTDSLGFPDFCLPVLRRLSDESGELALLAVVGDEGVVLHARAEPKQELRVVSYLGRPLPLHSSSAAKVWLASLPDEEALQMVVKGGLTRLTPNTITSMDAFGRELQEVRREGYGTNLEERLVGVNSMAAPIFSRTTGAVVGAVLLTGPASRLTRARMEEISPLVKQAAAELASVWPVGAQLATAGHGVVSTALG